MWQCCVCACVASKVKAIVHPLLSCAALTLAALALYAQVLGQTLTQQLHVSPSAVDHRGSTQSVRQWS
jgi:hypothetical protein